MSIGYDLTVYGVGETKQAIDQTKPHDPLLFLMCDYFCAHIVPSPIIE